MKTRYILLLAVFAASSFTILGQTTSNIQQPTSINTDGAAPAASAMLDVQATDKGMLVPRMTTAQRTAIASPATGLLVYDSDTNGFWFYNGTSWISLTGLAYTAGTGISIVGTTITNTGDVNPSDDIISASVAGGDLTGTFYNLQISANAVGTTEIASGAVGSAQIADNSVLSVDMAPGVIPATLPPNGAAGGDLSGMYPNPGVAKLQGRPVAPVAPADQQVLKWNATNSNWEPANDIGGGAGDNWGSQVAQTGPTLSGDGTAGNPLNIAQQAAANGQVLKWNGTTWIPANDNNTTYTSGAGISIVGGTITNIGDVNAGDDITTGTVASGDITGTFFNLQLNANSVGNAEIADGSVTAIDLAPGVIPTTLPPSGAAGGDLSGTYPNPTVAANAIGSTEITDASITAADLAAGVIPTSLPPSGAAGGDLTGTYPNPALGANVVTNAKMADDAIGSAEIIDGAVSNVDLANNAVNSAKIQDGTVTAADLAAGVIPTTLPPSGAAGGDLTGTYPNPTVAANAVGSAEIINLSVANVDLADNAVTTDKILDGTIKVADLNFGAATPGQVLTATSPSTAAWQVPAVQKIIADADNDTKVQVEETTDDDIIRFDIGGAEKMLLRQNTNGAARLELPDAAHTTIIGQEAGTNNIPALGTTGDENVFLGYRAGNANNNGRFNTLLGSQAGSANTSGEFNTAVGSGALKSNTDGDDNTAIGANALSNNTLGHSNIGIGAGALYENKGGSRSTAVGEGAMYNANNTTSIINTYNTAIGYEALRGSPTPASNTGQYNTAIGDQAMLSNTTGYSNVAVGMQALYNNTTRSNLVAVGDSTLFNNGTGATLSFHATGNTAVGSKALYSNTTGWDNTANGYQALYFNTSGWDNTANGYGALYSNTTGSSNTANGAWALTSNTTGYQNTANGCIALHYNTTGYSNTANGLGALYSNTTGYSNTANGLGALYSNTSGYSNTANGFGALYSNTTGYRNNANGYRALYSNTTGHDNTANGVSALHSNTTGNSNTAIGYDADVLASGLDNATAIGARATVGASNSLVLGSINGINGATSNVNVGIGTTIPHSPLHLHKYSGDNAYIRFSNDDTGETGPNGVLVGLDHLENFRIHSYEENNIEFYINNALKFIVQNSGNLGIGTASPDVRFHIDGGTDVALSGGGYIQTGPSSGVNIGIDNNEIMARNNGAVSDLYINGDGGDVRIGNNTSQVGVGRNPLTNTLEVEGNASKTTAGSWLANSDARLKKNITPLDSREMLEKLLSLQGVTYEWNDDKTGWNRPEGIQYGFTAQNIQEVFPTLVSEDNLGYLQTAYGTYDAMTVEAIRALNDKIEEQQAEIERQKAEINRLKGLETQLANITAALQSAGIIVEK